MSRPGSSPSFEFGQWDVDSLRLTLFYDNQKPPFRANLWKNVTGASPQAIDERPQEGRTTVKGQYLGNQLVLVLQQSRVDWHIRPLSPPNPPSAGELLLVTGIAEAADVLKAALVKSIDPKLPVVRLALAPVLIKSVTSLEDGFEKLSCYLPGVRKEFLKGTDFIYQINRPRQPQGVTGVMVNCLAKWEIHEFIQGTFSVSPAAPPRFTTVPAPTCLLTMDINNVLLEKRLPINATITLFERFVGLANELATQGDTL